ncbi:MAG: hypothetical protein ACRCZF_13520, partial [Gemmataceae bacterium]
MVRWRASVVLIGILAAMSAAVWWKVRSNAPELLPIDPATPLLSIPEEQLSISNPSDREHLHVAEQLYAQRKYPEVIARLNQYSQKDEGTAHLRAILLTAKALVQLNSLQQAEAFLIYVTEKRPLEVEAYRELGNIYEDQSRLDRLEAVLM